MWKVLFTCTRDKDHHYQESHELGRSPHLVPPKSVKCAMCHESMTVSRVTDLRQSGYTGKQTRRKTGGFKAEQVNLFDI